MEIQKLTVIPITLIVMLMLIGVSQPVNAIYENDNTQTHLVLDGVPPNDPLHPEKTAPKRLRIIPEQRLVGTGQYSEANLKK